MIYTLLGVLIIVLLVYIILSVTSRETVKEGMIDYFTIEQYLRTLPTTQGRYVRIKPSSTSGDGHLSISQIQVIDMNGDNIALKKGVFVSGTNVGSAAASVTVDGTADPRVGTANVWTSAPDPRDPTREYWQVDLGDTYQISQVIYSGLGSKPNINQLSIGQLRSSGMICDIIDSTLLNVTATQKFLSAQTYQTLTFPNAINITPSPTDDTISVLNPRLIPLNSAQPEVYLVTGSYTQQQVDTTCGLLGAVVATSGQVSNAKQNGASWSTPGWTIQSGVTTKQYILNNPTASGINTPSSNTSTTAAINCFGIKPASGISSSVTPFNTNIWSQYADNTAPVYYGGTTISVPDVTLLYKYVSDTLIPKTIETMNQAINAQKNGLPDPQCLPTGEGVIGTIVGGQTCGIRVTKTIDTTETYDVPALDNAILSAFNPNSCKTGGPSGRNPKCSAPTPFNSLIADYGAFSNQTLYSALANAPLNLILDDNTSTASQISSLYSTIQVFGTMSPQAVTDMNDSISLCSKIFLGSDEDVSKYINISINDLRPYIRATTVFQKFCKQEIVQSIAGGDYVFNTVAANVTSNSSVCNTPFTTDMLGLIPSPARDYIQIWIYNRTKRIIQYKVRASSLTQTDLNNLNMSTFTPSRDITTINNALQKMYPTVRGASISLDVTNNYILDKIAQAFYEAMGGNYIMSQIYDVFTVGGTIVDIRFDMTKHADISPIQAQIATLRAKYYAIRGSNVSQDIMDQAKSDYETNVADLQNSQSSNILPPVMGVVARFFYTYTTDTQDFTINGFTLDSRAVTSFIPELNCGVQVTVGGSAGTLNYTPNILYTQNVPEALPCTDPTTLRRIIDDYVNLTQTDLQSVLLGTKNAGGQTYTGPVGAPSMDTTLGTVHVNEIIGAIQISPTQCAIKWKETLWNDLSNAPVNATLTNVTRRALFSYTVNTVDWYSNTINIDPSGTIFYPTDTVPACIFDTVAWQQTTSPRLDTASVPVIQSDFAANGWNNGAGLVCPLTIPNYIFSAQDYCAANPSANTQFNGGGSGPLNIVGAKADYASNGIGGGRVIRAAQAITPLPAPIVIQQPLPPNNILDTLNDVCPPTTCEDLNVLYSLVDQYNNEPSLPGSILRVTKAYTASPYQCDVEVDINYDVMVKNAAGRSVRKGSFTYTRTGAETTCTNCPPRDVSSIYTGTTLALSVGRNIADCTFSLYDSEGRGSGTTIQTNTPALYKPMDYGSFLTDINVPNLSDSFNAITSAVTDAAMNTASILTTYRDNTVAAVGNIATLGSGCTTKCTDTTVMNNMLAFYKTKVNSATQINTVLRMGTLNANTCDMTYQEDTLTPSGGGYRIGSSKTAGMRFTLAPDTAACTFKTTAMTPILPSAPPEVALDITQTPSSATCQEVYGISSTTLTKETAANKCISYGSILATQKQLTDAAVAGATWTLKGFVVDVSGVYNPNGSQLSRSDLKQAGAICFGVKPAQGQYSDVLPFAGNQWNQGGCATSINYVNPTKEAFVNYGTPVQVSESTFPLNKQSFGLDMARNQGGPGLDTLFVEPLRSPYEAPSDPIDSKSYKYLRFKPVKTRDPSNPTVDVGKFRFLLGQSEVDLRFAKVTNPMGSWVGDLQDVVGPGYRRGFSDTYKKALVFAFPYAMLINGFTWTTANPDRGVGGDPVQWKLEGSQNGTYWVTLRDQTKHNYPVPVERYQELPVFRF